MSLRQRIAAPKLLILAAKDISQNRRVPLFARFFADKGYEVSVYSYTLPHHIFEDDRVKFHAIPIRLFAAQLLEWIEKTESGLVNQWRPRFGGARLAGYFIGGVESVKYKLRGPISRLVDNLWGHLVSDQIRQESLASKSYAHILRHQFGSWISDKRRHKFNQIIKKNIQESLDQETIIVCHDRFSADTVLTLSKHCRHVVLDIVELFRHRSNKSLESRSRLQLREIKSAENLLSKSILVTVASGISQDIGRDCQMQEIYNGHQQSQWAGGNYSQCDPKLIAFSGALFVDCGLKGLLKVLYHLPSDYRLLLVGRFSSVAYQMDVLDMISEYGLESRIDIIENADVEEMPKLLSRATVYIIPFSSGNLNLRVSMPNRLFDALAAGLPILAQKDINLAKWVKSRNIGSLIDVRKPKKAAADIVIYLKSLHFEDWREQIQSVFVATSYEKQMEILDVYLEKRGLYSLEENGNPCPSSCGNTPNI